MRFYGGISKLIKWLGSDKFFWRTAGILFLIGIVGAVVTTIAPAKPEADKATTEVTGTHSQPQHRMPAKADTTRPRHSREAEVPTETATSLPLTPSEEIEYYEANREYYLDDPEDILTYPDEIFDFNAD